MIRRLVLENFMTHQKTTLDFSPGVTVIVGPNNCGKSAVVEALRCLKDNDSTARAFIRHGAKEARVTVLTEEGSRIEWTRTPQSSMYKLDSREFPRLGQAANVDIVKALRMPDIEEINIHLSDQKAPVFLFDKRPGEIAKFFASSSDVDLLIAMQKRHSRRTQDAKKEREQNSRELERWTRRAEALATVPELENRARTISDEFHRLRQSTEQRARLSTLLDDLLDTRADVADLQSRNAALQLLKPAPELSETGPMRRFLTHARRASEQMRMAERVTNHLSSLRQAPKVHETRPLIQLLTQTRKVRARHERLAKRQRAVAELREAPVLQDVQAVSSLLASIKRVSAIQNKVGAYLAETEGLLKAVLTELEGQACPTCGAMLTATSLEAHG